ncbi:aldose 1-epimerase family protein [Paracoccus laeviglucosivorans]|uniref:Galactose mutarotase n=1 Tax=Paracoccus laeviglucosivorans TaxID=1197861 RepID=A0A521EC86_9RHOB|nr:aldose 1-epimerase family protein [Paracoccus laeviglucosivorans]SMO81525.1 Galactose mutarotase [Paracoccus laeviglucosivorans]
MIALENTRLRVELTEQGAELQSVRTLVDDAEWLWQGDPAWWTGRAPLLFPVVGLSPDGHVEIDGRRYPMGSHGFARHSRFRTMAATDDAVALMLEPSEVTAQSYPFRFALMMIYRLDGDWLRCLATVTNHDDCDMPFQFGFHPAFAWPLPGMQGQTHRVTLADGGAPAMHRPDATGLIDEAVLPSPFDDGVLEISAGLFTGGAMVFPHGAGRSFTYGTDTKRVQMQVTDLPNFALWQKPGAPYLCLEPWHGMAPFPSQGAALSTRNFSQTLAPGKSASFGMDMRFVPA